jgi:hypothetical protein
VAGGGWGLGEGDQIVEEDDRRRQRRRGGEGEKRQRSRLFAHLEPDLSSRSRRSILSRRRPPAGSE